MAARSASERVMKFLEKAAMARPSMTAAIQRR
jgi:hypothetical protein